MSFDAIAYYKDGTSGMTMYRGEPLAAVKEHAKDKIASGLATHVDVFDGRRHLMRIT